MTAIFQDIGSPLTLIGDSSDSWSWATPYHQHLDFTGDSNEKCKRGAVPTHGLMETSDIEDIGGTNYFKFDPVPENWAIKSITRFL